MQPRHRWTPGRKQREKERERHTDTQRDRQTDRDREVGGDDFANAVLRSIIIFIFLIVNS